MSTSDSIPEIMKRESQTRMVKKVNHELQDILSDMDAYIAEIDSRISDEISSATRNAVEDEIILLKSACDKMLEALRRIR